jgi:hypothetical protein
VRDHGSFVRRGWLSDNWIAWEGECIVLAYGANFAVGGGFSEDAGCAGCWRQSEEIRKQCPAEQFVSFPTRRFELRTPALCEIHGQIIYEATYQENSEEWEKKTGVRHKLNDRWADACEYCELEMDMDDIKHKLGLSEEEMERGGDAIIAARDYACGYIDGAAYLSILQDFVSLRGSNRLTRAEENREGQKQPAQKWNLETKHRRILNVAHEGSSERSLDAFNLSC